MFARYLTLKSKLQTTDLGASMVEYSLLVILIAIVCLVAVQVFGNSLSDTYTEIASQVSDAGS